MHWYKPALLLPCITLNFTIDCWVSVNLYSMILKLSNRSTSRVIVGETLRRSEKWLNIVTDYTHNLGLNIILLRPLPRFLRPFAAKLLPSVRYLNKTLQGRSLRAHDSCTSRSGGQ
jgi:hypothetical protein